MSLVSQALITTARHLISGSTWAGLNVVESPIDPIADMGIRAATDKRPPMVAIYVERGAANPDSEPGEADMKFYIYLPTDTVQLPNGVAYTGGRKNAGMTLNLIARQVENALMNGAAPWIGIWRRLKVSRGPVTYRSLLIEIENGVRIPAMEITMILETIPEPVIGEPLGATFAMFDAALRAAEGDGLADLIKTAIETPAGLHVHLDAAMQLGLSQAATDALGLSPVVDGIADETGTPPLLEDVGFVPPIEPEEDE